MTLALLTSESMSWVVVLFCGTYCGCFHSASRLCTRPARSVYQ